MPMMSLAPDLLGLLQAAVDSSAARLFVERSWLDTVASLAQSLISLLVLAMLVMGVLLLYALRKSVDELTKLVKSAHAPLHSAIAESREVTGEVRAIARSLKAPLELAGDTIEDASERLQDVMQHIEGRARRFDALVDIAQVEAEDAVLGAASLLRGVRAGGDVIRHSLGLTPARPRARRRARAGDRNGGHSVDDVVEDDVEDVVEDAVDEAVDAPGGDRMEGRQSEAPRIRSRVGPHR
ncbi:MAG: hypothetical protein IPF98_14205 [Gemmatimonadetes bacterium]|nr:hypothetical protein [Gemmatimonadota bacterium]